MNTQDTICAIATAQGGAIGIVRVSGAEALSITDKIFHPTEKNPLPLTERKAYTVNFGQIKNEKGEIVDEVLVSLFRAPHSYTGENSVEISCHGSAYILQQVMQLLINNGCRTAGPGEFTQRAFLNGKMDLSQAEAVADLIASTSEATHRLAMNQMRGGFSKELAVLRNKLLHLTSLMELELDFSDHEELEFADRSKLQALAAQIHQVIERLVQSFSIGNAIKNGSENRAAYQGGNFKDYLNRTISSSRITGADNAVLVWSDGFFMFKDIHLDAGKQNLVFTIDSNYMQQANAVLAVRDASNRIMWSWHIWVTERPVYTERHTLQDLFVGSNTYELMQCNLGWVDGKMVYYNQRDLTFRFTQAGSGKTDELKVTQKGATFDYKDVGSTYYQWGRKDPLVALKNWKSYRYEDYRLHETGDPDYVYRYETGSTTIGNAIQHPNVFYTRGTTGAADWNFDHTTTLWNADANGGTLESTTSVKTIYDPSPRGFKVPIPRAFAVWVNGHDGDESTKGELNGHIYEDDVHNKYRVYPKANGVGKEIPLTATGQRADIGGRLPVYEEYGPLKAEVGGLWSLYGVYYWTCVPKNTTSANTLVIRKDYPSGIEVYSYGFAGTKTMARPVRPIADR